MPRSNVGTPVSDTVAAEAMKTAAAARKIQAQRRPASGTRDRSTTLRRRPRGGERGALTPTAYDDRCRRFKMGVAPGGPRPTGRGLLRPAGREETPGESVKRIGRRYGSETVVLSPSLLMVNTPVAVFAA